MPAQELLTTSEAATKLGLSPRTLEGLRMRGGGPRFLKLGRAVRYSVFDLSDWLEKNTFTNTSQVPT